MLSKRILTLTACLLFLLGILSLAPGQAQPAQAQDRPGAAAITYNLYATDGYIEMADGYTVYNYGFVGGLDGQTITYEQSCIPTGPLRTCTRPSPANATAVAVAPTGGPVQPGEQPFAGHAQFPAPIIYAATGDVVEIRLKNLGVWAQPTAPNDPHSIHLHGLDVDAANDGVPETSVGAVPANLCADGTTAADCGPVGMAPGAGNVIVYMFSPTHVGTTMYHCHQEADIHVNMGMYGALVVYNPTDPAYLNGGPGQGHGGDFHGFAYDKDYVMLLSEIDLRGHADEEGEYLPGGLVPPNPWDPDPYNWALYQPQYWFINGLSFPNTVHVGFPSGYLWTDWIAAHPGYDPLITGSISTFNPVWGTPGEKALIRVINMGFETQPMHMHGYHGKVIGSDQRAWDWANEPPVNGNGTPFGQGQEKNTLVIGSGETYEWLVDFGQQSLTSTYQPGVQTRYFDGNIRRCLVTWKQANPGQPLPARNTPVSNTLVECPVIPEGGVPGEAPYLGGPEVTGTLLGDPVGAGSQYFPFHNHDDYKATNNGQYPGGMFTMLVPTP